MPVNEPIARMTYTLDQDGDLYAHPTGDFCGYAYKYVAGSWREWGLWRAIADQASGPVFPADVTTPLTSRDQKRIDATRCL